LALPSGCSFCNVALRHIVTDQALYTWIHYNTFVKLATVSVPRLGYLYGMLSDREKVEFLRSIAAPKAKIRFEDFALATHK
jgi:hypothetical protein